uniref:Glutamate 5-kinase n=1 Tax=Strigomonas oncopelti TaxID=5657 RepID=U5KL80_STROO|nr:glutamate 5-kinase [Strigomonas oncopelti]
MSDSEQVKERAKPRIVIKVGSSILVEKEQVVLERIRELCKLIADLSNKYEVILVSSGAVAAGYTEVKLDKRECTENKHALASVGQPLLMRIYHEELQPYGICPAQLLLGFHDFDSRTSTMHAKDAVDVLLREGALPIVNENDAIDMANYLFGDNDRMAAHVAFHFDADLLVILSDIEGYYDSNPRENPDAKILKHVHSIAASALQEEASPNNAFATGGIVTKLKAAKFLLDHKQKMFLTSGFNLSLIREYLLDGVHNKGTLFSPA